MVVNKLNILSVVLFFLLVQLLTRFSVKCMSVLEVSNSMTSANCIVVWKIAFEVKPKNVFLPKLKLAVASSKTVCFENGLR